jgi:hypothetical protein
MSPLHNAGANHRDQRDEVCASLVDDEAEPDTESVDSEDRSSSLVVSPSLLPIILSGHAGSKNDRLGSLGRWWKRIMIR